MDADILARRDGKTYIIEVVCSTQKSEADKLQHLSNIDKVIFVCKNRHDAEILKAEFEKRADLPAKPTYTICQISDVLNCGELDQI